MPKAKVVSLRLKDSDYERLRRITRRFGRTISVTAGLLLEEAVRQLEFADVEFREWGGGRQAYVRGSTLAVWEVAAIAEAHGGTPEAVAMHLEWPLPRVRAALAYAAAFPDEMRAALEDNERFDFDQVSRMLPEAARMAEDEC